MMIKLISFQIINCFGFHDSSKVNLHNENNFIYILGRNSSGKSSLLNAIKYFQQGYKLSEQKNFENLISNNETPCLIAEFLIESSGLNFESVRNYYLDYLNEKDFEEDIAQQIIKVYEDFVNTLNSIGKVSVEKDKDGDYHFSKENTSYEERETKIDSLIEQSETPNEVTFYELENILINLFPSIYVFNEKYPLYENLSNAITSDWEKGNNFSTSFINFVGQDIVNNYLKSNDFDEQEKLLSSLNDKVKELTDRVNLYTSKTNNKDLLEIKLHANKNGGIQITVLTDTKKSYYSHLSENTKFLFAYYLHHTVEELNENILLFDEPSNGFHPTSQEFILNFLKKLGKDGNLIIVSTHSEYLIDIFDLLSGIRVMSIDSNKHIKVKNSPYSRSKEKADYLALQPVYDAIGFQYGKQLNINNKVVITEGITELFYLNVFHKILGFAGKLNIAPAKGDGTIPNIIPLLISQGLKFKIVVDTGNVTHKIKTSFGIEDKYVYEIPIPKSYINFRGSGIEDLFTKRDFEKILLDISHNVTQEFAHTTNSSYMKSYSELKRVVANRFYENAGTLNINDFEKETIENFRRVLDFCNNTDWFYL